MKPGTGSRLVEGTPVHLDVGGIGELLDCTVLAFLGAVLLLTPRGTVSRASTERLSGGASGFVLVERRGRFHALGGQVTPAGDLLAVRLTDTFRLGERRAFSRAPLALDARLEPQGGGPGTVETTTQDVSPAGVRVHRPDGMPVWPRYALTLSGDGLDGPLTAEAVPARATPTAVALRLSGMAAEDRHRLTALVLDRLGAAHRPRVAA